MRKRLLIALTSVGAFFVLFSTGTAFASVKHANDACPAPYNTGGFMCTIVPANVTTSSSSSSSSHVKIVVHKTVTENVHEYEQVNHVKVGFSVMPGGLPKAKQGDCRWGDFAWSEWRGVGGGVFYAPNGHHGRTHACWDGHNWRQIGGGPGQWNCGNVVVPVGQKPPKHAIIVPRVVGFRSVREFNSTFEKWVNKQSSSTSTTITTPFCLPGWNLINGGTQCLLAVPVSVPTPPTPTPGSFTASASATAQANVSATAMANCPAGSTTATATASASGSATAIGSASATSTVSQQDAQNKANAQAQANANANAQSPAVQAQAQANAQANAQASASAKCTSAPPVTHFTNVSCTGFEEIFGAESMIIKCDVSNDNGAPISLDAHSNDGNSRVSGINCYSQGGTPSCLGNGQFEFRVTGINGGSTVLFSSITVTASSNGVNKTWTSDPFPVDPS